MLLGSAGHPGGLRPLAPVALEALGQCDYDVLLIDLNYTRDTTSGQEGLDLLARIQEYDSRLPVIVMTAWGNIDLAVESIKRGARDFIQKPWENERLISLIRVHAELHQPCAARASWNWKTACCAPKACRSLWPARPPCSRSWN